MHEKHYIIEPMSTEENEPPMTDVSRMAAKEDATLGKGLAQYQAVYMPSRNWAGKTRVNYRNDIADLIKFLEMQGKTDPDLVDLTQTDAEKALDFVRLYTEYVYVLPAKTSQLGLS